METWVKEYTMNRFQHVARLLSMICSVIAIVSMLPLTGVPTVVGAGARYESRTDDSIYTRHNLVKHLQRLLTEKGYNPGPVDGFYGPRTQMAVRAYQKDTGLVVDGELNMETLKNLGIQPPQGEAAR
jgi:peptidoglycan hydrolase-like protein with peptidoglycan-binding domain